MNSKDAQRDEITLDDILNTDYDDSSTEGVNWIYRTYHSYFSPYWKAGRLFEGPQRGEDAKLKELTTKYYIKRNTDDVIQIRQELSPSVKNTHPYAVLIGPSKTGKTELVKECAQQSGVRVIDNLYMLPPWGTIEEVKTGMTRFLGQATVWERQLQLILYGAKEYKKKYGKIPVLALEYGDFSTIKWARQHSQHIKVVFEGQFLPDDLASDHAQYLTLGGLSKDETRRYLIMKLMVDPPSNFNPLWSSSSTRDQVIATIEEYIEVVGGDLKYATAVKDVASLESFVTLHRRHAKQRPVE